MARPFESTTSTSAAGQAVDRGLYQVDPARDPGLASLHGDPEFDAIVAEVKKRIGEE